AAPKRSVRSAFAGRALVVPALTVTRSRPGPSGADATVTGGRGAQAAEGADSVSPAVGAGLGAVGLVPPAEAPVDVGGKTPRGPPPPKVAQPPQLSTTTSGRVAACPPTAWRTTKVACVAPAGRGTVRAPVTPLGPPGRSSSVFVPAANRSACSALLGVPAV